MSTAPPFVAEEEVVFDGGADAPLCPLDGVDLRKALPDELFERRPWRFVAKFLLAYTIVAGAIGACIITSHWAGKVVSVVVLGLMYAHLVELQHECLHRHAFSSRRMNRAFGFLAGLPMLSSHSHYRHDHLRHHAYMGTARNREFFNYRFEHLDSVWGFLCAACHMGRYVDVFIDMGRSYLSRPPRRGCAAKDAAEIRRDYRLYGLALVAALAYTVIARDALFLWVWVLPAFVAEPTHFLIEMPEHFGLNTQSKGHVMANTRTIRAGWLGTWFTNGNNLHTAHHYHQGVPMTRLPRLHESIRDRLEVIEPSYWVFFTKVIRGEIQNHPDTCMTR